MTPRDESRTTLRGDGTYSIENRIATMHRATRLFLAALPVPVTTWPRAGIGTHLKTLEECGLAERRGDMWERTERGNEVLSNGW